jgi:hypothetical protein
VAWQGRGFENVAVWCRDKEKGTLNEKGNCIEADSPNTRKVQCKIVLHVTRSYLKTQRTLKKIVGEIVSGGQGM